MFLFSGFGKDYPSKELRSLRRRFNFLYLRFKVVQISSFDEKKDNKRC